MAREQTALIAQYEFGAPAVLAPVAQFTVLKGGKLQLIFEADSPEVKGAFTDAPQGNNLVVSAKVSPDPVGTNYGNQVPISTISGSGGTVTVNTTIPHGLTTGDVVTIGGVTPASYNQTGASVTVTSTTAFTYSNASTAAATGGTVVLTSVIWNATTAANNLTAITSTAVQWGTYVDATLLLRQGLDNQLQILASGGCRFSMKMYGPANILQIQNQPFPVV